MAIQNRPAVVDEADSVLIDEAVTPLIISQKYKNEAFNECFRYAHGIAQSLRPDDDYSVDFKHREIKLTPFGLQKIEQQSEELPSMWRGFHRSIELVKQSLVAKEFFIRGKDYIIEEEKVIIVDPSTGRQKKDSTWRGGVHQAIEIKEGLPITDPAQTLASMSFQNFFRLFARLSATTGTARTSATEFWHVYRLPVIRIPTHRPSCIRRQLQDRYFATLQQKWAGITIAD